MKLVQVRLHPKTKLKKKKKKPNKKKPFLHKENRSYFYCHKDLAIFITVKKSDNFINYSQKRFRD